MLFMVIGTSLWARGGAATTGPEELLEVTWNGGSGSWAEYPDNPLNLWLIENMNIRLVKVRVNSEMKQAMAASGDLTDIWSIEHSEEPPYVEAGYIVPFNDLVDEYGVNIKKYMPLALEFAKEYRAHPDGKFYGMPGVNPGVEEYTLYGGHPSLTMGVRWDYWKEIGTPRPSTIDEAVDMLAQMVKNNPTTEEGLRVYGLGGRPAEISDLIRPMCSYFGYQNINGTWGIIISSKTGELVPAYSQPDSPLWTMMEFWYKQNQAGIFDPDMFLATSRDDIGAKAAKGQYVAILYGFMARAANAVYGNEGKGFVGLPWDGGGVWGGSYNPWGGGNSRTISAKAKDVERVFQFLDWGYGEEALRFFANGIPGENWDVVDGMATLRQETIDLWKNGGEPFQKSGIMQIGWGGNMQGFIAADGQPADLFNTDRVAVQLMTKTDIGFARNFGFETPRGYWKSLEADGSITTHKNIDYRVKDRLPQFPNNLRRIITRVEELIVRGAADIIMAPNDSAYEAGKSAMLRDIADLGFDQVEEFVQMKWDELSRKFGPRPDPPSN